MMSSMILLLLWGVTSLTPPPVLPWHQYKIHPTQAIAYWTEEELTTHENSMMRLNSRIVAGLQNPFVHGRNFHQFFRKDEQPNKTNGHLAFMSQRRMFRIDQKERNRPISVKTYCSLFPLSRLLKIRPALLKLKWLNIGLQLWPYGHISLKVLNVKFNFDVRFLT